MNCPTINPKHCHLCHLYHTDSRYRARFDEMRGEKPLPKPRVPKGCGNCHKKKATDIDFERVVVINLKRRPDRLEKFLDSTRVLPWRPQVFEAVDASKLPIPQGWKGGGGAWGCLQSHRQILERAILDGVQSVLVLEDDAEPVSGFADAWKAFQSAVPEDWEMLLLGGQHRVPGQKAGNGIVKCFNTVRTHAYALRGQMLRDMYAFWCGVGVDTHLDNLAGPTYGRRKVYAPEPFLFQQSASRSDITGRDEPPRSWSKPTGNEVLLYLDCDRATVDKRRESGEIHTGYDRCPYTGVDAGLVKLFQDARPSVASLRKWVEELQSEATAAKRVLAFWFPGIKAYDLLQQAWQNVFTDKGVARLLKAIKAAPAYHSKEAFDSRLASRPRPVEDVRVFYHAALMPGWQSIVEEQLRLCAHVGLKTLHCGVLGSVNNLFELEGLAQSVGVDLRVLERADDFSLCEGFTLDQLHQYAVEHPTYGVLYFHTKGVTSPDHANKRQWRRVMMREMVAEHVLCTQLLSTYDAVGVAWQPSPDMPHFAGNFWWARCDWIASLDSCSKYRESMPERDWCGMSWKGRFYAETWLGSRPWHHVESVLGFGRAMWTDEVFGMHSDVDGFEWEANDVPH